MRHIDLCKPLYLLIIGCFIFLFSCIESNDKTKLIDENKVEVDYQTYKLPKEIKWITNNKFKIFASSQAKKGGTFRDYIKSFPLTFRTVGPDSNSSTRSYFMNNNLSLLAVHPDTEEFIPSLATHWAFSEDGKTAYFKLNTKAEWSDGIPVTADDFIYTIEFMRSKYINDPSCNSQYINDITAIKKYNDSVISITIPGKTPDILSTINLAPIPRHFYKKLGSDFIKRYNWEIVPNTGPYILIKYIKGKYLLFERKENWWGENISYNKNRFNIDKYKLIVIKDDNVAFEYFKKGELDAFNADSSLIWHEKGKDALFEKGYIHKIWFYTDKRRLTWGFWLNLDKEIFKDINCRYAFAHAINFEILNKKVLREDYERLNNFFTGFGEYTNNMITAREYSIPKVENYMKAAGWKRGQDGIWEKKGNRYSVIITYGSPLLTPIMIFLREEAKKAGIEFKLDLLDPTASYKKAREKKHEVCFTAFCPAIMSPVPREFFHSENAHKAGTNNLTNTDNPEMDRLIDAYDNSMDRGERIRLCRKIQQKIHDMSAWIPLYQVPYTREFFWRWIKMPEVAGTKNSTTLAGDPAGVSIYWIDEKTREETLKAMKEGNTFKPVTIIDVTFKNNK